MTKESWGVMPPPAQTASTLEALGLGNGNNVDMEVCLPVRAGEGVLFVFNTYLHGRVLVEKNYQAHLSNP